MHVYLVGGCVRDRLLARLTGRPQPSSDRDWVVVGATPEDMLARGYLPVGNDFPVFLHPKTHEEYALARTERKTAPGYHGFVFHAAPDVTLEEDLRRRDLTINAMALDDDGQLIDPYGGLDDLKARRLRHVSPAFEEDPVRILRAARFAARFPDFRVADETLALMRRMVDAGEVDALVPERIFSEFSRGLTAEAPLRMLDELEACGLWARLYADIALTPSVRALVERLARDGASLDLRLLALTSGAETGDAALRFLKSVRAPASALGLAQTFWSQRDALFSMKTPEDAARVFEKIDVVRRRERAEALLLFCSRLAEIEGLPVRWTQDELSLLLDAWTSIDAGAVAKAQTDPRAIPEAVRAARREALLACAGRLENARAPRP